jgi:hypothetical protein
MVHRAKLVIGLRACAVCLLIVMYFVCSYDAFGIPGGLDARIFRFFAFAGFAAGTWLARREENQPLVWLAVWQVIAAVLMGVLMLLLVDGLLWMCRLAIAMGK